jgi:mannan endo-1,4-beta-mannosidase
MSLAVKTATGLAQRVVTWAGGHHTAAAVGVILGTAVAAVAIIVAGPPQPGGAELVNHYPAVNVAANDPARPPYPVRAPLPLPVHYVGVYEPAPAGRYVPSRKDGRATDKPPKIAVYYSGWSQGFKTPFADNAQTTGAVPLVQIEPKGVSLAAIASGGYDSYLRAYADAVAAYQGAVIIGFGQEMNEYQHSWGYLRTGATVFVQAWQHIVNVFRSQNADNVTWIWTIGKSSATARPLRDWWPGAQYVTWVGIDGYYELPGSAHTSAFARTIASVRRITGDPVLLFGGGPSAP